MPLSVNQQVVLLAIRRLGSATQLDIKSDILEVVGKQYARGALYTVLQRLGAERHVDFEWAPGTNGRGRTQEMKCYRLTAMGEKAVREATDNREVKAMMAAPKRRRKK